MPNTRILLGYRTEHRNSEAVVLATATRDDTLKAAVDAAPAEFVRFELGTFQFQRKARRSRNSTPKEDADSAKAVSSHLDGGSAALPPSPTLPATPARETAVAEGASSAAASEPAQPATDVVGSSHGPAAAVADEAADGGEDDEETPLIPGQPGGKKRR